MNKVINLHKVLWKVKPCPTGENCWCRMIEPIEPIKDENGEDLYIAGAGVIKKADAEYIVKLHNENLLSTGEKTSKEWYEELKKEKPEFVIYDPDGWDRTNYNYSFNLEHITSLEFNNRVLFSTCIGWGLFENGKKK